MGIGRTFQKLEAFGSLSAQENVLVAAEQCKTWDRSRGRAGAIADEMLDRVGISDVADFMVGTLPTGTARLVELARALATNPGRCCSTSRRRGSTRTRPRAMAGLLRTLVADGLAVLLVEHDMSFVMGTCEYIYVLDFGQIIAVGTPAEIQADPRVQTAYLGSVPAEGVGRVKPLLELRDIRAGYGTIDVLHGVDLVVEAGQVYALLGPNGAGKSTTLGVCSGQILPSAGQVLLNGREVNGVTSDALARAGVCLVPEGRGVFPNLTVTENLRMFTYAGTLVQRRAGQGLQPVSRA